MELLEALRRRLQLDYISDLRWKCPAAWQVSAPCLPPADAYTPAEWDKAVRYLAEGKISPAQRDRAAVLGLLVMRAQGGGAGWPPSP